MSNVIVIVDCCLQDLKYTISNAIVIVAYEI